VFSISDWRLYLWGHSGGDIWGIVENSISSDGFTREKSGGGRYSCPGGGGFPPRSYKRLRRFTHPDGKTENKGVMIMGNMMDKVYQR